MDNESRLGEAARWRLGVLVALGVGAVVALSFALAAGAGWPDLLLALGGALAGAWMTFLALDRLWTLTPQAAPHETEELTRTRLKTDLIAQLHSEAYESVVTATQELRRQGWLEDGSLEGVQLLLADLRRVRLPWANLRGAAFYGTNLQDAVLYEANLQQANLSEAKLQGANLEGANLQEVHLFRAYLRGANLYRARLQEANLSGADLQDADLRRANLQDTLLGRTSLQGANLTGARLRGTDLESTIFDQHTTLPDGSKWSLDTDLARFTDPNHPDFWRSTGQTTTVL